MVGPGGAALPGKVHALPTDFATGKEFGGHASTALGALYLAQEEYAEADWALLADPEWSPAGGSALDRVALARVQSEAPQQRSLPITLEEGEGADRTLRTLRRRLHRHLPGTWARGPCYFLRNRTAPCLALSPLPGVSAPDARA